MSSVVRLGELFNKINYHDCKKNVIKNVEVLIELIRLTIYENQQYKAEDRKKKLMLIIFFLLEGTTITKFIVSYSADKTNLQVMIFVYCFLPILIGLIASIVKGKNEGVKKVQLICYILTVASMCVYLFFNFEVLYDVVGIYGFGFIMATIYYLCDFSKYDKIRRKVSERILEVEIMGNQMNNNINELEMSKKRDHKIMITDEAIKKVPRIKYKEIVETEYDNLQELARQVLKISKDENDSNEVAVTYSLESAKLIGKGKRYIGVALGKKQKV